MKNHRANNRSDGFTLIEVLIALAVIAVALSAIIRTTGIMTANTGWLKEKTYAHWIAQNRMTELRVIKSWPSPGTTREQIVAFGREWEWIQKISKTEIESFRRVDISVIATEGGDEDYPIITLAGFLLEPRLISQVPVSAIPAATGGSGNPNDPNDPNSPNYSPDNSPSEDDGADGSESP